MNGKPDTSEMRARFACSCPNALGTASTAFTAVRRTLTSLLAPCCFAYEVNSVHRGLITDPVADVCGVIER